MNILLMLGRYVQCVIVSSGCSCDRTFEQSPAAALQHVHGDHVPDSSGP